ncbi:MAG: hypothetical protein A2222_02675, partial [Nitrospirae bacterium RIFOXYA2_FULL_44_9]
MEFMSRSKAISIGIGCIALYFIIETSIDTLIFKENNFINRILHPDLKELWLHLSTILIIIFAVFAVYAAARKKESKEMFRAFFEGATDGILLADRENKMFIMGNKKIAQMLGYTLDEITGMGIMDIHPTADLPFVIEQFERQARGEITVAVDIPVMRKDGSVFYAVISATPVSLHGRNCLMGIFRDVTERKKAEEMLKQALSLQIAVVESTTDGILVVDKHGKIASFNKKFLELWRIPDSVIASRDDKQSLNFILPQLKNPSGFISKVEELYSQPEAESFDTLEFRDGRTFERYSRPQKIDGNTIGRVWSFRDVTDRKQTEEELFQTTQDWQDTFNSITDMVTVHDKDFNIIHANKAAEKILGLPLIKDLTERKCFRFYHGTELPPERCPSCSCLKTGEPATFEIFEPHLNMHIEIRAIPRFDSSHNIIGLIHVVRDITEHRKLEAQLQQSQKMEAVGTLTGGIAHDFNNILTAIIGYGNILKMKLEKESPLLGYTDQILASADRAANLTQSLLAFSRKQVINPKPVNLNEITASIEKILLRIIGEDIELKTTLSGMRDLRVMADAGQIEQVLMNLAANARDAMPEGGTLTIETGLEELDLDFLKIHEYGKQGMYAILTVTDTGHGMDENTRQRIFEPFFTTKEVGRGTGLGLSMVYGIIKQHSGYINCYSEPEKGTTFKIYLPVIESATEKTKKEEHITLSGGTETILLAEDEEEVRKLMRLALEEAGYKVIEAVDGKEAIEKFRENKDSIGLLLLDVIMPKMNGKGVYEEARKIKPGIKALFSSGYPADFIHKKGILEEGLNFISKPASPHEFLK